MRILPEAEARAQEDLHVRASRIRSIVAMLGLFPVAAACTPAAADDYSERVGVILGGGAFKMVGGNVDHASVGPYASFGLRFGLRRKLDVEFGGRTGFASDDSKSFRTRVTSISLGGLYSLSPDAKWTLQGFGGVGVHWWHVMDLRGNSPGIFGSGRTATGFKEDGNAVRLMDNNVSVHGGLGAEMEITPRISLRGAVRADYLFEQTTDNTGASDTLGVVVPGATPQQIAARVARAKRSVDANDLIPSVWVGVTYWFGERDGDADGIPNRTDACPDQAEDQDGFQDEDGCPDLDDDEDGIADASDKCAREAEDKDGFEDEDGCPDADNDKDGVADADDKCVDVAEDKDGFQDGDGCPDFDNDGDAVADSLDQCAETPTGVPVDAQGCPTAMRLDKARLLPGIGFKKGTAELAPASYAALDSVVASLRAYPAVDVEVHAAVAPSGQKSRDDNLAQRRADAVVGYLVQRGADASRLTAIGFGSQPLVGDGSLTSAAGVDAVAINPAAELPPIEEPQQPKE
jgi:outer membrane protein OmpA-like peptidoglycan-associated protein